MAFAKSCIKKNRDRNAGELTHLGSTTRILLVYDAQRHIELFSCVSSGKHRKVQKSEMHDFVLQDCVSCFATEQSVASTYVENA